MSFCDEIMFEFLYRREGARYRRIPNINNSLTSPLYFLTTFTSIRLRLYKTRIELYFRENINSGGQLDTGGN